MYVIQIKCSVCGEEKEVGHSTGHAYPTKCCECEQQDRLNKKNKHLLHLTDYSLEERIAKIEEWIYDEENGNHKKPFDMFRDRMG